MLSAIPFSSRFMTAAFIAATIAVFGVSVSAQEALAVHAGYTRITGLPDDWTHHHVVFSNPGTEENAIRKGTHDQWLKTVNDPRYVIHQMKHHLPVQGPASEDVNVRYRKDAEDARIWDRAEGGKHKNRHPSPVISTIHRDWSMSLGTGGHLGAGQYPAKYNFSTSSASCNDFVVYPTGLAGSTTQANVVAYYSLYGGTSGTCGSALTRPDILWAYNTGSGGAVSLSPVLSYDGTQVAYIQTASSVASLVLLTMTNSGGTVGSPVAPNSVTNVNYPGCTGAAPPCYTTIPLNGSVNDTNSPPYYDYNNDIMYVGDDSGKLHKFTNVFNGSSVSPPAEVTSGGWPVTVSAQTTPKLTGAVYDPVSTFVFVGDASGYLYRVTATGTIAATASGQLGVGTGIVDAPLIDSVPTTPNVYVFVGDNGGNGSGLRNEVYQFSASPGFTAGSSGTPLPGLDKSSGSTTLKVFSGAFDNIHYNGTSGNTGNLYFCSSSNGTTPSLYQIVMNATFSSSTINRVGAAPSAVGACSPVTEFLGTKVSTTINVVGGITAGATSITVASGTGIANTDYLQVDSENMQVTAGGGTTVLSVTRGLLGTTATAHSNGATVQDIQDWIFASMSAGGADTGCTGACLYNYLVTSGAAPATAAAGLAAAGGTSGIIIDNSANPSAASGESQVYYTTLGNQACTGNQTTGSSASAGCAVQVSQSGLN